jgi:hypothetical protein
MANNDLQNTTQKNKDQATRTPLKDDNDTFCCEITIIQPANECSFLKKNIFHKRIRILMIHFWV